MGAEAILGTPEGRHMPRKADTRVRTAVHLAVLLAAACSATASAANLPFTVQTPRYEVQTDVSPGFTQLVAAHMEQINAEYARRFPGFAQGSQRFRVLVFAGERGYRRAVPRAVWGSTGVFAAPEGFLAAHLEGRTVEEVLRTLYHEGFHQFVRTAVSRTFPTWLNEGLAEYFSEATWDGRGFTAGLVPTMRLHTVQEAIRHQEYVPFDRLFSLTADSWLQNVQTGGRRADIYYCEAWSVVQFLMHGEEGRHVRALDALLKAVAEGRPAEDARREVFGPDLRAVEDAWARYMMSLTPSPKFQCRDNMEIIMVLARMLYTDPRAFRDPAALRHELLNERRARWQVQMPTGRTLHSEDLPEVNALFRCPFGRNRNEVAYVLVPNRHTGLPTLVYDDLPGIVITAYYRQEGHDLEVVVEELVRDTVPEADLRALHAARNAQFR